MEIELTSDQQAFIRRAIEQGRFERVEDAIEEALRLWEERERRKEEILAALDSAEASLAAGAGRPVSENSVHELGEGVKERGRRRRAGDAPNSA